MRLVAYWIETWFNIPGTSYWASMFDEGGDKVCYWCSRYNQSKQMIWKIIYLDPLPQSPLRAEIWAKGIWSYSPSTTSISYKDRSNTGSWHFNLIILAVILIPVVNWPASVTLAVKEWGTPRLEWFLMKSDPAGSMWKWSSELLKLSGLFPVALKTPRLSFEGILSVIWIRIVELYRIEARTLSVSCSSVSWGLASNWEVSVVRKWL